MKDRRDAEEGENRFPLRPRPARRSSRLLKKAPNLRSLAVAASRVSEMRALASGFGRFQQPAKTLCFLGLTKNTAGAEAAENHLFAFSAALR